MVLVNTEVVVAHIGCGNMIGQSSADVVLQLWKGFHGWDAVLSCPYDTCMLPATIEILNQQSLLLASAL